MKEVRRLRYAIIGGDARAVCLARLLLEEGHRVHSYALEKAVLPGQISKEDSLQAAVYGADCVVLPVPAERSGLLNAPLSEESRSLTEILEALWPGQPVFGGGFGEESLRAARQGELRLTDLLRRAEFTVGNAALTAEGALGILIRESDRAIWGGRVLVCGWGRIGRLLSLDLDALGAEVTVAARDPRDRAMARALGLRALDYPELGDGIGDFEFIVNTVPARVLTTGMLCGVSEEALLLELASAPGGFDSTLAANLGLRVLRAPGLPGKTAPWAAARLIRDCIERVMEEGEA